MQLIKSIQSLNLLLNFKRVLIELNAKLYDRYISYSLPRFLKNVENRPNCGIHQSSGGPIKHDSVNVSRLLHSINFVTLEEVNIISPF